MYTFNIVGQTAKVASFSVHNLISADNLTFWLFVNLLSLRNCFNVCNIADFRHNICLTPSRTDMSKTENASLNANGNYIFQLKHFTFLFLFFLHS